MPSRGDRVVDACLWGSGRRLSTDTGQVVPSRVGSSAAGCPEEIRPLRFSREAEIHVFI